VIVGGIAEIFLGVNAEGKSLENIAKPLGVIAKPSEAIFRAGGTPGPGGLAPSADD
jgi:hypothetical protein